MKNPYAGGAEVVNEQLAKRLVADGHEVIFLVRTFRGAADEELVDGYKVVRMGNHHTVYWEAYKYYRKHLVGWADLVIEGVNTIPFFCNFYVKEKNILFFHQLCREIWFYELGYIKGLVGYVLESIYLFFLGRRAVVTVSKSTKQDLGKFGFPHHLIHIISQGTEIDPVPDISLIQKYARPTILSLGALRPMKRTDNIVRAFELAKANIHDLELVIAGDTTGKYGAKVLAQVAASPYRDSIRCLGRVSREKKVELMQRSHFLAVTSVKEGWGLVVTEANSQGTPAVVYDIDGLRDSVKHGETGLISPENNPAALSAMLQQGLENRAVYENMRQAAWQWSKAITFDRQYEDFKAVIGKWK